MSKTQRTTFHPWSGPALSVLVLAAASSPAAVADPVSKLVVFGDSSSDQGSQGAALRPTNQGQMWSERLAERIGRTSALAREFRINASGDGIDIIKPGGSNYAVNGSTVLDFDCCLSFSQQIDFFVEDRQRFAGDELVAVWFDRNDIETAFVDGLPYTAAAYADEYIAQIQRLKALGAANIVAIGWELDLILAQFALDAGRATPETLALLRAETANQREALFPRLQEQDVFLVDLNTLGADILANPLKYGFNKTRDGYQEQGNPNPPPSQSLPNDGNVFTLDGHLTSAAQAVVADYILAQVRARDRFASTLTQVGLSQRNARQAFSDFRRSASPGWSVFAAPFAGRIDQEADGQLDSQVNQTYQGLAFGARHAFEGGLTLGGGISLRTFDDDFATATESAKGTAGLITFFVAQPVAANVMLDAHGAYGATDFTAITRDAMLGDVAREHVTGSTGARQVSIGMGLTAKNTVGDWVLSTRAGVEFERTTIEGYAETANVLALNYGDSTFDATLGRLDIELAPGGDRQWRPFLAISAEHDFLDDDISVEVGPSSDLLATYSSRRGPRTQFAGELGVDFKVTPTWSLRTSLAGSSWSGDGGGASASGTVVKAIGTF